MQRNLVSVEEILRDGLIFAHLLDLAKFKSRIWQSLPWARFIFLFTKGLFLATPTPSHYLLLHVCDLIYRPDYTQV